MCLTNTLSIISVYTFPVILPSSIIKGMHDLVGDDTPESPKGDGYGNVPAKKWILEDTGRNDDAELGQIKIRLADIVSYSQAYAYCTSLRERMLIVTYTHIQQLVNWFL